MLESKPMHTAIIVSTYNSPDWLEKVLWGYAVQTRRDFAIVIADDGSGPDTRERVDRLRAQTGLCINHQWHEATNYQRQKILNQCLLASEADYAIFTDGDCIPRRDFVSEHLRCAERGCFLSGGYVKLSTALSRAITQNDITSGRCFQWAWLRARGLYGPSQTIKVAAGPGLARWLNRLTPTKATWNNCNSSGWRSDLLAVNGFDERMRYGGADRELGARLEHAGIRRRQIRHTAIVLHLDHERSYATPEARAASRAVREETDLRRRTWTEHGVIKGPRPAAG